MADFESKMRSACPPARRDEHATFDGTAADALAASSASVAHAHSPAAYGSSARLYEISKPPLGMPPQRYKKGAPGVAMHFAVAHCSLGAILIAATDKGTCCVLFGDDAESLVHDLERRFSAADLRLGEAPFDTLIARVIALIERPTTQPSLPLDLRGTVFQIRVWEALRAIPAGTTVSYGELAARLGAPKSFRAVAQACGQNPIAVLVPCHRVVRADGDLSGYRWGIERKRELLDREQHAGP